ncbi:hypothetical protein CC86DRAFT_375021 [Ophiobolus disseminans]|uniref:Uncharacterized protein n=1 Tax=Ophiobolus disseminans TaxID=1469910 RepID=A0A6A6ZEV6_9PLEO|nr:hypothetical protein CC86DRAFT_375021 [Ophiobolus disseminans]
MSLKLFTLALAALATATPLENTASKATNDDPCEPCRPQGATGTNPPAIGSDLSPLYLNILSSVKNIKFSKKRTLSSLEARDTTFCCRASLDCVNVQSLNIPMCYDKFTTNYAFADNSYGSLTTGEYNSNGGTANLLTGTYSSGSQQGNIYAAAPADKPNTSTLSIPPQYTGTGTGSAVPANQLGSVIVYTTTIAGQTYTMPTIVPQSVRVNTISGQTVTTTFAPVTITQATIIPERTTVVTTTREGAASASASATGAAGRRGVEGGVVVGAVAWIVAAL